MAVSIHNNIVYGPEERPIPAHLSFGQFVFDKLKNSGDNIAQICAETGESVTYRNILQNSVNLAVALQELGLKKGDVVALSSENRFEFTVASLAIIYCGGVLSTLNVTYSTGEISHIFQITKPKFIFTSPITAQNMYDCSQDLPHVEKIILFGEYDVIPAIFYNDLVKKHVNVDDFTLVDVNGVDDTVAVMCSSGTTGLPKGVMLTHVNFLTLCAHMKYYLETSQERKNHKVLSGLSLIPWFHAYGFITSFAVMCLNVKIVFLVRFDEEQFLETIQKYKINMTTIVPPLAVFLAKHPLVPKYDLTSLNEVWCGAAPLSREIQAAVSKRTGIGFIRQGYGLTEVTMACCVDLTNGEKMGSCGTPAPGMRIKVLDTETNAKLGPGKEGEIWIKSPLGMKGYMGDKASSDELVDKEGYIRTGDIGYYDNDGYFYIVDRLKELIKYKGFQVAPAELEALLLRHAGVADCGVVGRPDEAVGELPVAFVVPQPGVELTADEITAYVASKVSPAKHLRGGVIFVEEIPKNPSGKILRRELRKLLSIKLNSKL
ncbi:4-coumarate--CoA ligase 1-like [Vanessa cardui]|uniref:4-coumarate--CoA ligase 1-like n=1 Tax=Vanessa cardui TaxID=171605 RepID=UPI001F12D8DC|nr:4-coumarate--CoA ligase 1-like [Vanessa cardui]XP_046971329.1 4-coumarate--CoA ligase 1-like [Vanessa cardui]